MRACLAVVLLVALSAAARTQDPRRAARGYNDALHPWSPPASSAAWPDVAAALRRQVKVALNLHPAPPKGPVSVRVDGAVLGRDEIAAEVRDALVLDREGGRFWQGYLGFLGALPFCLGEPDVFLEEEVAEEELDGRPVLAIRAHFQPGVGTDRWTFWFEPETAELVGCRFDRADPNKAGETILISGAAGGVGKHQSEPVKSSRIGYSFSLANFLAAVKSIVQPPNSAPPRRTSDAPYIGSVNINDNVAPTDRKKRFLSIFVIIMI